MYILFAPLFLFMNLCLLLLLRNLLFLLFYNNSLHMKDNPLPYVLSIFPVFYLTLLCLWCSEVVHLFRCFQGKLPFFIFCLWWPSQEYMTFKTCFGGKDSVFGMAIGRKRKTIIWPSFIIAQLPKRGRMHSYPVKSEDPRRADPTGLKYFLLA